MNVVVQAALSFENEVRLERVTEQPSAGQLQVRAYPTNLRTRTAPVVQAVCSARTHLLIQRVKLFVASPDLEVLPVVINDDFVLGEFASALGAGLRVDNAQRDRSSDGRRGRVTGRRRIHFLCEGAKEKEKVAVRSSANSSKEAMKRRAANHDYIISVIDNDNNDDDNGRAKTKDVKSERKHQD